MSNNHKIKCPISDGKTHLCFKSRVRRANWVPYLIAYFIFVMAYWGVTTNSDWGGYERLYDSEGSVSDTDRAFAYLSVLFNAYGLSFRMFFRFHILLIGLLYMFLYRKLRVNSIVFTIVMLLYSYVAIGNQIRYYVGFPAALLSLYNTVNKKYVKALLLGLLSIAFHSSLLLFYLIFLFYYYFLSKIRIKIRISVIVLVNIFLLYLIQNHLSGHFTDYLSEERTSGVLGGIYNLIPSFIYIFFIYNINNEIRKIQPSYLLTNEYRYLYTCIMMGTVLILCSIPVQIIGSRMMNMAIMPIWLTYFIRAKQMKVSKIEKKVNLGLFYLFVFYTQNALGLITGAGDNLYQIKEMLDSYTLS